MQAALLHEFGSSDHGAGRQFFGQVRLQSNVLARFLESAGELENIGRTASAYCGDRSASRSSPTSLAKPKEERISKINLRSSSVAFLAKRKPVAPAPICGRVGIDRTAFGPLGKRNRDAQE